MRHFKVALIIFVILLVSLFVFEHAVLVAFAKNGLKYLVDLDTHMNRIIVDPLRTTVTIRGLKIYNPPGFKDKILANVPLIVIDFNPRTIFEEGVFFNKIDVDIKELNIIRNKDNVVNLSQVKALTPQEKPKKVLPFNLARYEIEIEKVRYINYMKEDPERVKEIDLNLKEEYKDVKVADNLANVIAFKIFFNGKIGNIGVDIQKIQQNLAVLAEKNKQLGEEMKKVKEEQLEKAKEAAKIAAEKTKEAVQVQVEKTKEDIKSKVETVKEAADKTIDVIKEKTEEIKEKMESK
jgi:methyl-accepting chemotaxis protein